MAIQCPHCGSPVMVRGRWWECGYCGDCGKISSLQPSEKAKLLRAATPSVQGTITVTGPSDKLVESEEETSPRSFARDELEDMVRRWDFSENEWACRDLLIAAFPGAVRRWSPEEQQDMLTMDVLLGVSEYNPHTAIRVMQLLLDTAEEQLTKKEATEQLFSWDLHDLLLSEDIQPLLFEELKWNDRLASQLFQSAYVGEPQESLLEACDQLGETDLKTHLQTLLTDSPYFKGLD